MLPYPGSTQKKERCSFIAENQACHKHLDTKQLLQMPGSRKSCNMEVFILTHFPYCRIFYSNVLSKHILSCSFQSFITTLITVLLRFYLPFQDLLCPSWLSWSDLLRNRLPFLYRCGNLLPTVDSLR